MRNGRTNIKNQLIVKTQKDSARKRIVKVKKSHSTDKFDSTKYWEERYFNGGNSGNGSYGFLAEYKKDFINQFIVENNIKSLLEYGCGDCNQLSMIDCEKIIGVDVSKTVINICQNLLPNSTFIDLTVQKFPKIKSDLLLSLDVIYHLIEDNIYEEYIENIVNYGSDHLIIYSSNFENDSIYAKHVKPRNFTKNEKLLKKYDLKKIIENKYKSEDHTKGSFSDWYIFKIKNKI
jgi:hypothetical protein